MYEIESSLPQDECGLGLSLTAKVLTAKCRGLLCLVQQKLHVVTTISAPRCASRVSTLSWFVEISTPGLRVQSSIHQASKSFIATSTCLSRSTVNQRLYSPRKRAGSATKRSHS